jgi:RNA polymerase I-specific transcription initiation factor RRN7
LWSLRLQKLQSRLTTEALPGTQATPGDNENDRIDDDSFSSQEFDLPSDGEDTTSIRGIARATRIPSINQALATMHLAFQILRLPFLISDLLTWVQSGSMPYQEVYKTVPKEMFGRMPAWYQRQFLPKVKLTSDVLVVMVTKMALLYNKDFGLVIPPLNVPPLLFRLIEELALPLEVYAVTRRLAAYMRLDFKYATVDKNLVTFRDLPEAQLASCIIAALQLFYNLDGINRVPEDDENPATAVIDWDAWTRAMDNREPLEFHKALNLTDRDAIDLSELKIDDYLDIFEEHFMERDPTDREQGAAFRKMMLEFFPLTKRSTKSGTKFGSGSAEAKQEMVQATQLSLKPNRVLSDDAAHDLGFTPSRPGVEWAYYKNVVNLTGRWKIFYNVLARVTGIPLQNLITLSIHTRSTLLEIQDGLRRQQKRAKKGRRQKKEFLTRERLDTEDMLSDIRSDVSERMSVVDDAVAGLDMEVDDGFQLYDDEVMRF